MDTVITKVKNSIIFAIQNMPDDFSFAYTFFRNYRQELDLLKKEIQKARNTEDKINVVYLESAQKYIEGCMQNQVAYVGGCSIPPVLDAIQTLAYRGTLLFSHSVAYYVKNRIEEEVAVIRKECEYCKLADKITSSSETFEQLITIIRDANCETDAIDMLQSEMSLRADEAEFMLKVSMSTLSDRELILGKTISMLNLLGYLTYLKTIINP